MKCVLLPCSETSMPLTSVMQQQGLHSYFHYALYHLQGAEQWCGKWKRSSLAVETSDGTKRVCRVISRKGEALWSYLQH